MAHAGVTILPRRATKAMQDYLEGACMAMQEFPAAWRAMTETRALSAKLIGAKASEIALLGPTSVGLSFVAERTATGSRAMRWCATWMIIRPMCIRGSSFSDVVWW